MVLYDGQTQFHQNWMGAGRARLGWRRMHIPAAQGYPMDANRVELLLDAVADYAIYMLDPDGFVTTWNAGAERIKGYQAVEIVGQHFSRFFSPEDRESGLPGRILEVARKHGRHEAEGWRVRKDGTRFWANAIAQPVLDEQGALVGFAKVTRDITERVQAQRAILETERRFRILVDGVIDYAIYMLDPSGIITNWNTGAERMKGYSADEIIGQHFSTFYTKEDRSSGLPARVLDTAARVGRYEAEGWRVRKDGSRFWASVVIDAIRKENGNLEGFAKVTRDITERRTALETLRESERQFRLLVGGVTDYAIYMLDPNGIVISWNAGAERIKGYTADEIVGHHFSRFYTEADRSAGVPARALYTATMEGRFEAEGWRVRNDGTMFWANVVIDPIRDEDGELIGFAKITRDITERRQAQLELQEAQRQRAHAQRMDALGQLTGGVAHDFNNLLMIVSGHIRTIQKAADGDPRLSRSANAIAYAAQRGTTLTRQLLTFSRRQTLTPSVFQISERVNLCRTILESSVGSDVRLGISIGQEIWPVNVDESEFELALVNVALNARDAMPNGGALVITAENVNLTTRDTVSGIQGEFVAVRITDTGSGIAPDVLPKIFDPFFTTKELGKGSGLGLSQVHGFAHQSGGTVHIESQVGRGTTVTIYLPRCEGTPRTLQSEKQVESAGDGTVLVVEDNPEVLAVCVSMLEQLGYKAYAVSGALAALEVIENKDFDLVLSDIVMPGGMDGAALANAIRARRPQLPVLLATGFSPSGKHSDHPVIRKPFDISELSRTVARLIAEAKQPPNSNLVRLSEARRPSVRKPE
jgi:PAS domain S-box-containing protein